MIFRKHQREVIYILLKEIYEKHVDEDFGICIVLWRIPGLVTDRDLPELFGWEFKNMNMFDGALWHCNEDRLKSINKALDELRKTKT